jgi:hypothetical protein
MKTKGNVYCMGINCPIRTQCLRYTKGLGATMYDGIKDKYIQSCTNQRKYVQDESNVNTDSKNITMI